LENDWTRTYFRSLNSGRVNGGSPRGGGGRDLDLSGVAGRRLRLPDWSDHEKGRERGWSEGLLQAFSMKE